MKWVIYKQGQPLIQGIRSLSFHILRTNSVVKLQKPVKIYFYLQNSIHSLQIGSPVVFTKKTTHVYYRLEIQKNVK